METSSILCCIATRNSSLEFNIMPYIRVAQKKGLADESYIVAFGEKLASYVMEIKAIFKYFSSSI